MYAVIFMLIGDVRRTLAGDHHEGNRSTENYGSPDDLQLRDIDQPTIGDHDVLVRVHAASVDTADRLILRRPPI